MKELGEFTSKDGRRSYDCHFITDEKIVRAVGPLPDGVGARRVALEERAENEEEAKRKIVEAINQDTL